MFLVLATVAIFSLIVGSFLNVVVYRLPIMLDREWKAQATSILGDDDMPLSEEPQFNLAFPNSHCPTCQHAISVFENIPVFSYLFLGGKCSHCAAPISIRYPVLELLTAILSCTIVYHFGLATISLAALILTWSLLAASFIDYDHQILPDNITLPLLWLGLMVNSTGVITDLASAFWGVVFGYLILWSLYWGFKILTGKEGMGYGDFKLLAMLGAWLGWQAIPLLVVLSSFAGALVGVSLILLGRDRTHPIPYGPFLAAAGFVYLLWGETLTSVYLQAMID